MHLHLPKPVHGWRALLGEVGIIVLGVLIALGAEQLVETLHWRREARDFRQAVDHELSLDFAIYEVNQLQQPCIQRRLDELQEYLIRSRDGATIRLSGKIGEPLWMGEYTSVWANKDAQLVEHMPIDERLKYAAIYDEFRLTADIAHAQTETWHKLVPFEEAGPLTLEDRRQLHSLLEQARNLSSAMDANWPFMQREAAALGLKPNYPREWPDVRPCLSGSDICKTIAAAI